MEKNSSTHSLTQKQGQTLVKLARKIIAERLGRKITQTESDDLSQALHDDDFQAHRGVFVTLTIDDQLRGCIGSLVGEESIIDGIKSNAIHAAFHDCRFTPLTINELDRIDIEVSILSEPKPLKYTDSADLTAKLRVNIDGVIIRKGHAGATFLPQVWEQLPKPEAFLSNLCLKAGMPADAWKKPGLEIKTYQVQYFEEKKMNAPLRG